MILATVDDEPVTLLDGVISDGAPDAFRRPATAVQAVERVEAEIPVIERVQVIVEPGSGEHFRAVVRKLGGSIVVDDGD